MMLAVSETTVALIVVASIGAIASVLSAWVTNVNRRRIKTNNGQTLGQITERVANVQDAHGAELAKVTEHVSLLDAKVDTVSDTLDQHVADTAPLVAVFLQEHPDLRPEGGESS